MIDVAAAAAAAAATTAEKNWEGEEGEWQEGENKGKNDGSDNGK